MLALGKSVKKYFIYWFVMGPFKLWKQRSGGKTSQSMKGTCFRVVWRHCVYIRPGSRWAARSTLSNPNYRLSPVRCAHCFHCFQLSGSYRRQSVVSGGLKKLGKYSLALGVSGWSVRRCGQPGCHKEFSSVCAAPLSGESEPLSRTNWAGLHFAHHPSEGATQPCSNIHFCEQLTVFSCSKLHVCKVACVHVALIVTSNVLSAGYRSGGVENTGHVLTGMYNQD